MVRLALLGTLLVLNHAQVHAGLLQKAAGGKKGRLPADDISRPKLQGLGTYIPASFSSPDATAPEIHVRTRSITPRRKDRHRHDDDDDEEDRPPHGRHDSGDDEEDVDENVEEDTDDSSQRHYRPAKPVSSHDDIDEDDLEEEEPIEEDEGGDYDPDMASIASSSKPGKASTETCDTLLDIYSQLNGDRWWNKDGWSDAVQKRQKGSRHPQHQEDMEAEEEEGSSSGDTDGDSGEQPTEDASGNCCSWFGVTCQRSRVIGLSLPSSGLSGTFPESLFELKDLQKLNLSSNSFPSPLPDRFNQLQSLITIDLRNANLTGAFPFTLGTLPMINNVHLEGNSLTGPANFAHAPMLRNLHLSGNDLGENGIVVSDVLAGKLKRVVARNAGLSGDFGSLGFGSGEGGAGSVLEVLDLADNDLSGSLPDIASTFPELITLDLSSNDLSGPFPASYPATLHTLRLDHNGFSGNFPDVPGPDGLTKCTMMPNNVQACPPTREEGSLAAKCGVWCELQEQHASPDAEEPAPVQAAVNAAPSNGAVPTLAPPPMKRATPIDATARTASTPTSRAATGNLAVPTQTRAASATESASPTATFGQGQRNPEDNDDTDFDDGTDDDGIPEDGGDSGELERRAFGRGKPSPKPDAEPAPVHVGLQVDRRALDWGLSSQQEMRRIVRQTARVVQQRRRLRGFGKRCIARHT